MHNLNELYRQVIMDHYKRPRNKKKIAEDELTVELNNPSCGDQILLSMQLVDNKITSIHFAGDGCSISMASASMMTEAVKGKEIAEVKGIIATFLRFMQGEAVEFVYEDLEALQGVVKFPARIKCATLAWKALEQVLGDK